MSDDTDQIQGVATILVRFKADGITQLRLDLINKSDLLDGKGMEVRTIAENDKSSSYTHDKDVLIINLNSPSVKGEERFIRVNYSGIPASGLKIAPNKHGDRTFFSDNWPNRARNWLPTVDHPYDKATSELRVTAPDHYQVISNGLLLEESYLDNGMKVTHWKQSVPICTWLYVLGVAEFAVQYYDTYDGKSLQTWVYKQDREAGFYDFAVPTKWTLEFFSEYVGPYQYEKLANIQSNSVGGGMEAASAIFYGDNSVTGDRSIRWRNVIIHEVAHQWFGNAVTESDWDDVWLSEGFATYFTLLFIEHAYGRDEFVQGLKSSRDRVFSYYKEHPDYRIVHDNLDNMDNVTSSQTYQKGAWILHMLRNKIGNEAFESGIKSYYDRYVNTNATTEDFKIEMEKASSKDLDQYFDQWLYQGGNIILNGSWAYDEISHSVKIEASQVQKGNYSFDFPIEFGIYKAGAILPEVVSFDFNEKSKSFEIPSEVKPERVVLDPETKLLAEWTFVEKK